MNTSKQTFKKLAFHTLPGERHAPCTREGAVFYEDGLRLLAKLIAKAIQRARERQIAKEVSK